MQASSALNRQLAGFAAAFPHRSQAAASRRSVSRSCIRRPGHCRARTLILSPPCPSNCRVARCGAPRISWRSARPRRARRPRTAWRVCGGRVVHHEHDPLFEEYVARPTDARRLLRNSRSQARTVSRSSNRNSAIDPTLLPLPSNRGTSCPVRGKDPALAPAHHISRNPLRSLALGKTPYPACMSYPTRSIFLFLWKIGSRQNLSRKNVQIEVTSYM